MKEVKMLCPTRFIVDATENSKDGGVTAEVCSSQTGLRTKSKATYYYLRHENEAPFKGRISERCPTNTTHHPPTYISEWSDARQRKTLVKCVGGYRSVGVGHQVKKNTPE